MFKKLAAAPALIGPALIALLLNGSCGHSAGSLTRVVSVPDAGVFALNAEGKKLYAAARLEEAREFFVQAAALADSAHDARAAAMNRNNAGFCETATMQYGAALRHLTEARTIAEDAGQMVPLIYTLNSLASLYVMTGQYDNALSVARNALNGPAGHADKAMQAKLLVQISGALVHLHRLREAAPYEREAVSQLTTEKQFADLARLLAAWGEANVKEGDLDEAEQSFQQGFRLVEKHHLPVRAILLVGMANLESARHRLAEASRLFEQALKINDERAPRWRILSDRARFRRNTGDDQGSLADYREVNRLARKLRVDMVPADRDRVDFESGIGNYLRGLVDVGNRIALRTGDVSLIAETFDAAEQHRLWSIRTLIPSVNDWRRHLPPSYWEKLAKYQQLQRRDLAAGSSHIADSASDGLKLELQQLEAAANSESGGAPTSGVPALDHARSLLDADTVIFSFHISQEGAWVWAVEQRGVTIYPLPDQSELIRSAAAFADGTNVNAGRVLYRQLFGRIPASITAHRRWLLELDGPLHNVPFGALVTGEKTVAGSAPVPEFLVERAALQTIPGSALLQKKSFRFAGAFVGVGDPVYNAADPRFEGRRGRPEFSLPRLPGTARELELCSRAWGAPETKLLTGMRAGLSDLRAATQTQPSILHFATHVVTGTGDFRSGLIALSLNNRGAMDLLGPQEILARPVPADLVVMNGCHSSQSETIPTVGRMGLTRAWLGAGAGSVLATLWDIADDPSQEVMAAFYRALRKAPEKGVANALRESQLIMLRADRGNIARWAGYYLLGRTI